MTNRESSRELEVEITPRRLPRRLRRAGEPAPPRIPRITRLMALAIKFDEMIRRGEVRDYAELARLGYVSRARITQIMNLLNLAPEIQEELLFPDTTECGHEVAGEKTLRLVLRSNLWREQRDSWHTLCARTTKGIRGADGGSLSARSMPHLVAVELDW